MRGRPPGWLAARQGARRGSLARAMLARDGGGFPRRGAGRAPARSAGARAFRACSNAFVRPVRKCMCARPAGIVCARVRIRLSAAPAAFSGFARARRPARNRVHFDLSSNRIVARAYAASRPGGMTVIDGRALFARAMRRIRIPHHRNARGSRARFAFRAMSPNPSRRIARGPRPGRAPAQRRRARSAAAGRTGAAGQEPASRPLPPPPASAFLLSPPCPTAPGEAARKGGGVGGGAATARDGARGRRLALCVGHPRARSSAGPAWRGKRRPGGRRVRHTAARPRRRAGPPHCARPARARRPTPPPRAPERARR